MTDSKDLDIEQQTSDAEGLFDGHFHSFLEDCKKSKILPPVVCPVLLDSSMMIIENALALATDLYGRKEAKRLQGMLKVKVGDIVIKKQKEEPPPPPPKPKLTLIK